LPQKEIQTDKIREKYGIVTENIRNFFLKSDERFSLREFRAHPINQGGVSDVNPQAHNQYL